MFELGKFAFELVSNLIWGVIKDGLKSSTLWGMSCLFPSPLNTYRLAHQRAAQARKGFASPQG
jgi:hypothetical protein